MIKQISKGKEDLRYRVFCDECNNPSDCTHEDPGDLAIKAKKEKFVTVPGAQIYDPMSWLCGPCSDYPSK